jgi:hypothetical protein
MSALSSIFPDHISRPKFAKLLSTLLIIIKNISMEPSTLDRLAQSDVFATLIPVLERKGSICDKVCIIYYTKLYFTHAYRDRKCIAFSMYCPICTHTLCNTCFTVYATSCTLALLRDGRMLSERCDDVKAELPLSV